ncbi:hypothetical protein GDO78_014352 [Eleutherodactylus coqui]|uniref:C-type lectin domain-containing protein n=1 Tax=Eleutherodactylus coqui TaxID=57060 RepID=A0A8J6EET1_ELECQ|nr:hypothetical protein GDO78_014352 [Eleutherodactylus coqui]
MDRTEALRSTEGEDPGGHLHQVSKKSPERGDSENSSDSYKYCPPGWHQIGKRCYYFSSQQKPRIDAEQDCQQRSATLARVEEEHSALKDIIKSYSRGFWIGLHRNDTTWMWPDKTIKDFRGTDGQNCAKASPQLSAEACRTALPWICETTIRTCSSTTEALRCLQPLKWEIGAISI